MKLAIAFFLAPLASPAVSLKTNKIRRGEVDEYTPDGPVEFRKLGTSGTGKSKSGGSCYLDGPCDASDYASYGYVDFKHGEIRYDFRYDVKCTTPPAIDGCCDSNYGFLDSADDYPAQGTGKACIQNGGVYIADDDNDASFSCCDPRLFEDLLNSKYCVVDGSKGVCWQSDDDCTPIRYANGGGRGGGNGAASGILAGVAGCDEDKVLEIFNSAPQCSR